jgi:hypothetical protein
MTSLRSLAPSGTTHQKHSLTPEPLASKHAFGFYWSAHLAAFCRYGWLVLSLPQSEGWQRFSNEVGYQVIIYSFEIFLGRDEELSFLFWCTYLAFCTVLFIYLPSPSVGPEFSTWLAIWNLSVTCICICINFVVRFCVRCLPHDCIICPSAP